MLKIQRLIAALAVAATFSLLAFAAPARAADPIKVGFSMALTGSVAQNGKQLIIALELWRDDVNANGGLLGRYATNMVAAAMPVIMQHNMATISILAINVNRHFHYARYFDMIPVGPEGTKAFSRGFFALAAAQEPKPQTVAIVATDAEFSKTSADGARENAEAEGFKIIYDQTYPPSTTDFAPVVRAVQAANPDLVFVAAYPPDTVGIVRAAAEIGLNPKMLGGTMIGLLITPIKTQLGPMLDGIVISESFVPAPSFNFPGVADVLKRYQVKAAGEKIDPIGYAFVPFGYAAGQVLAQAVEATKSLDHARLADFIHQHTFSTVVGEINYAADGAWAAPRTLVTQFQNVAAGNIDQFRDGSVQPVLWPPQYKTGTMIYPYAAAKK